jgi:uncharacterized membrane protein YfcA
MLFPAVLLGGSLGAAAGSDWLPPRYLRILTALLVLYAAARLFLRYFSLAGGGR